MTERGRRHVQRSAHAFAVGPSQVQWDGQALVFDIDERSAPMPLPVRGQVRVHPQALCRFTTGLDSELTQGARHRWGPIAPCSRVEVDLQQPGLKWSGHAYLDSNEGDEPVDCAFREWDWSRAVFSDGSTAVIYDVRLKQDQPDRVIAQRFGTDGHSQAFEPPPRQRLPRSKWGLSRHQRSDAGAPPARVQETLEDTPFYVRSVLNSSLLGQQVISVHESLDLPRLVSLPVRLMLPWRMPRRP